MAGALPYEVCSADVYFFLSCDFTEKSLLRDALSLV